MKYIIDLDGTLMAGNEALKGAPEFIRHLQQEGSDFLIMTNGVKPVENKARRLASAGMPVSAEKIINPLKAINAYLEKQEIRRVFPVGSQAEKDQLQGEFTTIDPELVVLLDFEQENIGYGTMQQIFQLLQKGIPAVSASYSEYYLKEGVRRLDTGAFTRLLESAAGVRIPVLGKPSLEFFRIACSLLGEKEENREAIRVVGDDWSTDIRGAAGAGLEGILIRSGKYRPGDEDKCAPAAVIDDLTALL